MTFQTKCVIISIIRSIETSQAVIGGPKFEIAADRAVIVLGHSERASVGYAWANALDKTGLFPVDIEVVTLNRSADPIGRVAIKSLLEDSTLWTHSGGITRLNHPKRGNTRIARQVIAVNPPERVPYEHPYRDLIARANDIIKDPIQKEPEAHKTGLIDLGLAGLQLGSSPISSLRTMQLIGNGYSTTERLIHGAEHFPEGRALVHSANDGFGFAEYADMSAAAAAGVTTVMLQNHHHNEVLFAPKSTLEQMSPAIIPADAIARMRAA